MKTTSFTLFAVLLFSTVRAADAAEERIGQFVMLRDTRAALLVGPITGESESDFDAVLASMPDITELALDSPGGQVVAALAIANKVHALGISTLVDGKASCASACAMVFLAGRERFATGPLGVHQMSAPEPAGMGVVQHVISDILDAFGKFGVDARVTRFMLTTAAKDMYFFSEVEKADYRINRAAEVASAAGAVPEGALVTPQVSARRDGARFADYPASPAYRGKSAKPRFVGDAEWAANYRTRVREGLKAGPNFAGSWSLVEIGCGTSCRFVILVDGETGNIVDFPLGGEEAYQMELTYTVDSRLVKAVWMDTENGNYDTCVQQDFQLTANGLEQVWENRYTITPYDYCSSYL